MGKLTDFLDGDVKSQTGVVFAQSGLTVSMLTIEENDNHVQVSTVPNHAMIVKLPPVSRGSGKFYAITYSGGTAPVVVVDHDDDESWINYELRAGQTLVVYSTGTRWTRLNEPDDLEVILKNHVGRGGTAHAEATILLAGFMSALDKQTLDRLAMTPAYSHPTGDGNLHVPATGTSSLGMILRAGSTAGDIFWGMLSPSEIGAAAAIHANDHAVGGRDLLTPAMIGAALVNHTHNFDDIAGFTVTLDGLEQVAHKGAPNGYAPLDASRIVPSVFLPSFVDDIIEVADVSALPEVGEAGKVYIDLSTDRQYRWGGTVYVPLSASPGTSDDLVEGSKNLFFTPERSQQAQIQADWNAHGSKAEILNKPDLKSAAFRDVSAGDASAEQVVLGKDSRLTDARVPLAHTHNASEIQGLSDLSNGVSSALARSSANALAAATGTAPSFYVNMLDYAHTETGVPPGMRFTRECQRTVFDPNRLLREVPANVLRHSWNPNTGVYEGALFEANNENLLPMSDTLTGASWISAGVEVVPNSGMCPDGSNSATLLKDVSNLADLGFHETSFPIPADDATYTASIFVSNPGSGKFRFSVYFHNGTLPAPRAFSCEIDWASMSISGGYLIPINNNWYRLVLTVSNAGYNTCIFRVYPTNDDPGLTGQSLVWGAQFERGPYLSNFNYTAVKKTGLVGNLLKNSDQLDNLPWNTYGFRDLVPGFSSPLGPVGWLFSDLDTQGDAAYLRQEVAILPDQEEYTFSVYLKKGSFSGNILEFRMYTTSGSAATGKYLQMITDWNTFSVSLTGTLTAVSHSFTSAGDGWYRAVCTIKNQWYSFASLNIYPCLGGANQTGSVYVASPRIEKSSTPGSTSSEFPDCDTLVKTPVNRIVAGNQGTMLVVTAIGGGTEDLMNLRIDPGNRITIRGDSFGIACDGVQTFSVPVDVSATIYAFTWHGPNVACATNKNPIQRSATAQIPVVSKITIGCDSDTNSLSANRGILIAAYIPTMVSEEVLEFLVREA